MTIAKKALWAAAAVAATFGSAAMAQSQRGADFSPYGDWQNPKRTVTVRATPCGDNRLCGTVIWASESAKQDARENGTPNLIGTSLLRDYRRTGANRWSGRVFVPDNGNTYGSHIRQRSPDRLTIAGCILGGIICQSQEWTRIAPARPS